jgi:3-oxoadipate enol-lactonase
LGRPDEKQQDSDRVRVMQIAKKSISGVEVLHVPGPVGKLAIYLQGPPSAPVVLMTHSILSSSGMWDEQAQLLASEGWRVVRIDTRGHGNSQAGAGSATMCDLASDTVSVLDALQIQKCHYVGLSLGGMSGFGLALNHADRLLSLCLCDARADAPSEFSALWDGRIATARAQGCGALALATTERWFGKEFLNAHPVLAEKFQTAAANTSVDGFVACAQAIQGLNFLPELSRVSTPCTLVVGAKDIPLPQAMREIQEQIANAVLDVIPNAGHLPNVDQPELFNEVLLRHLKRVGA